MDDIEEKHAELNGRVDRIEWELGASKQSFRQMEAEHKETISELNRISRQISQVRWILLGAAITLVADNIGVLALLKGILLKP